MRIGHFTEPVTHTLTTDDTHLVDVVPGGPRQVPFLSQPMSLDFHLKPTLNHRVPSEFGQRTLRHLVDLPCVTFFVSIPRFKRKRKKNSHAWQRCILPKEVPSKAYFGHYRYGRADTPIREHIPL